LRRLADAKRNARQIESLIQASTPTRKHCDQLAKMLGVGDATYLRAAKP